MTASKHGFNLSASRGFPFFPQGAARLQKCNQQPRKTSGTNEFFVPA